MSRLSTLRRVIALHLWSGLLTWRWPLIVPAFAFGAFVMKDILTVHAKNTSASWRVDAWDLFPAMLLHNVFLHFLFGFGFLLLIGDSYLRERGRGTAALAVMRMPSRSLYWIGKIGALGLMALIFVLSGLAIVLLVGMVVAPPSSGWPMLPREAGAQMYPQESYPLPVYNLMVAGYTAWALWVLGCGIVLLSHFIRHRVVTLLVMAAWTLISAERSGSTESGYGRMMYMGYFIGYFKHLGDEPIPVWTFFAITGAMIALMALLGSRKIKREEL